MRMLLVLGVVFVVSASAPAEAEQVDKEFHQSFQAREGTVLALEHGDGDVNIIPWEEATIDVVVKYRGEVKTIGLGKEQEFDV